jgi:hypothetical protein
MKKPKCSEVILADADLAPNKQHPLANLKTSERECQRLIRLAEILAEAAKRRADEQANSGKERNR